MTLPGVWSDPLDERCPGRDPVQHPGEECDDDEADDRAQVHPGYGLHDLPEVAQVGVGELAEGVEWLGTPADVAEVGQHHAYDE